MDEAYIFLNPDFLNIANNADKAIINGEVAWVTAEWEARHEDT